MESDPAKAAKSYQNNGYIGLCRPSIRVIVEGSAFVGLGVQDVKLRAPLQ